MKQRSQRETSSSSLRAPIINPKNFLPPQSQLTDEPDFTVVRFGAECLLRGNIGRYMTAHPVDTSNSSNAANKLNTSTNQLTSSNARGLSANPLETSGLTSLTQSNANIAPSSGIVYSLGVKGMGVSDPLDCITFVNVDQR